MILTKQDIDALVEGLPPVYADSDRCRWVLGYSINTEEFKSALYLAAGLNADGSEKAEVMHCALWSRDFPERPIAKGTWDGTTFTPDAP